MIDETLVMYGNGAEAAARRMLPKVPDGGFAPIDLDALGDAAGRGLRQVVLVAGLADQAAIVGPVLGEITRAMDGGAALAAEVAAAEGDADPGRAYALWESAGRLGPCGRELCRRTAGELERRAEPVAAQVVLVDATGERMVGMFGRMAR
ncbi:hypothetical protein [Actinomadura algeriensis]|uniref:Cobalt-precorrin-5B (C1)-methyltransferase n=1 Tax=Actinomadura algeriensis TaxID=1679523 RepID=A0ABR9JID0_9ACTN|nr:hypothetical protein [Actinomadura algeriensis]MBE1530314.1 cobalt-precorrin-5B (C1)-methyltransferase [Actinomadura algeriensis]